MRLIKQKIPMVDALQPPDTMLASERKANHQDLIDNANQTVGSVKRKQNSKGNGKNERANFSRKSEEHPVKSVTRQFGRKST